MCPMSRVFSRVVGYFVPLVCVLSIGGCKPQSGSAGGGKAAAPVERPTGPLTLKEAQEYVLALVNQDRAEHDLEPVRWDDTLAKAGERHARDMASHGFTAHWGTDGSVPEQRYSEAGGQHMPQENAACFFDAETRELDPDPRFDPLELEKIESAFINEKPPHDGHRQNILKPVHNLFGVGLAKPVGVAQLCMAQEFADAYGAYEPLPETAKIGQKVTIAGEVHPPVQFGGVGVGRIDLPKPTPAQQLNTTSTYRVPDASVLYFPKGFKTPKPVEVEGNRFSIEVPLNVQGRPGRYQVSVWGKYPGSDDLVMVSLRTVIVK